MASILTLLRKIEIKPTMYIGRHEISCLCAFVDGWYLRDPERVTDANIMEEFQTWIVQRFKVGKISKGWCDIILFYSSDEHDALLNFFKLFNEFLETHASITDEL